MNYIAEALEEQRAAERDLVEAYHKPWLRPGAQAQEREVWRTDLYCLERASPYYWNSRTTELVSKLAEDFDLSQVKASRHLLHTDTQWFYFAEDTPFSIEDIASKRMLPVRAISTYYFGMRGRPYLGCTAWTRRDMVADTGQHVGPLCPTIWSCVWEGNALNDTIDERDVTFNGHLDEQTIIEVHKLLRFVAAANTFFRQELLTCAKVAPERHARKRLERAAEKVQDIAVVALRRTHSSNSSSTSTGESREWNFQWTVRGHVRMQPYKSLGEVLPIYIHPYVKGPEDKPLKPRTTPIFSVTR